MRIKIYAAVLVMMVGVLLLPLAGQAVTISPPLIEYEADGGDMIQDVIKVRNESNAAETYYLTAEGFVAAGTGGQPKFTGEQDAGLASWIKFPLKQVTVQPGNTLEVPFEIAIPTYAVGGQYAAIFFSTQPPAVEGQSGVGVGAKIGTLLFVKIAGEADEKAAVNMFKTKGDSYSSLPVDFNLEIENTGNVHVRPGGNIVIKNMLGSVAGELPVNSEGSAVLPKQKRLFDATWLKNPQATESNTFMGKYRNQKENYAFGKYTAELTLSYGEPSQFVRTSTSFWVIPWHVIIVNLLGVIIIVIILYFLIKKYNDWLIKKVKKAEKKKK